jgi:hypothetical protein
VYGRMQFADFVVSVALQSLSRGLLKLSETHGPLAPGDEKALLQMAERLLSLWQMVQWSIGKLQFERAQQDLKEIVAMCGRGRKPEVAAAERLLERAEGKVRRTVGDMVAELSGPALSEVSRERLGVLLQAESHRWRETLSLRSIDQLDLVDHGILRAFTKGRQLSAKLDGMSGKTASAKRLMRTGRWVRHSVNHLELLRPALSESGRTRRWHMNRLSTKLEEQWSLERFARAARQSTQRPKAAARLAALIEAERKRLDKQRGKLAIGAFAGGDTAFRGEVVDAVAQLGLETITLLPVDGGNLESGL